MVEGHWKYGVMTSRDPLDKSAVSSVGLAVGGFQNIASRRAGLGGDTRWNPLFSL